MRKALLSFALVLMAVAFASAADTSALRPPKGAKVAIVAFEDLQCPDCAAAEPVLMDAIKATGVPLVRHDFPLPQHAWAFDAHIIAKYLDTKSPAIGEEYRHWIYTNQPSVNKTNLRGMSERFAEEHKIELPENLDPKGELAAAIMADFKLGQRTGVEHTPTIFVVSDSQRAEPFVEVVDSTQLIQLIEEMKKK